MTFFEFCCKRFDEEHPKEGGTPIFDVAAHARRDLLYPKDSNDRRLIRIYLESQEAKEACLECFEEAFDEYERTLETTADGTP